jgi:uncharacterized protein (DUF305 family)
MKRLFATFAVVLAAALAACSGSAKADGPPAGGWSAANSDHNSADVTFAQDMIVHLRHGIEMASLAATRASSRQVKELASRIKKVQRPEITTMTGWLYSWNEPTSAPTAPSMGGMTTGGTSPMPTGTPMGGGMSMSGTPMSMPGMMSGGDMAKLAAATGRDFDRRFLTMVIAHDKGGVTMATSEERDGRYPPAKRLATSIRTSQTAEIREMNSLLAKI